MKKIPEKTLYRLRWQPVHLLAYGDSAGCLRVVTTLDFMQRKVRHCGLGALLADYRQILELEFSSNPPGLDYSGLSSIYDALRLSATALDADPEQLRTQLVGRLRHAGSPLVSALLQEIAQRAGPPWLRPVRPFSNSGRGDLRCIWDTGSKTELTDLFRGFISDVWPTADGRRVLVCSDAQTINIYSVHTGLLERSLIGHSGRVSALAIAPTSPIFASASLEDHTRRIWSLDTYCCIRTFTYTDSDSHLFCDRALTLTPDGTRGISSEGAELAVWDTVTGLTLLTLSGHKFWITNMAMSKDGERLLTSSQDQTAILWDLNTGDCIRQFIGHKGYVQAVAFGPEENLLLTGSRDKTIRAWGLTSAMPIRIYEHPFAEVRALAVVPNRPFFLAGGSDGTVRLMDYPSGKAVKTFQEHRKAVTKIRCSLNGDFFVSGAEDAKVCLWNLQ